MNPTNSVRPIVSILMPCYNAASFIGNSIESVAQQSINEWELIVVDDASTDDSLAVVRRYADRDPRIKIIELRSNKGAAVARNTALRAAKGRYIAFLDADDRWFADKLAVQLAFMKRKNCSFVYSSYTRVDEQGNFLNTVTAPDRVSYESLLKVCVIGCLTVMYDSETLGKVEMPPLRKRQDFGLWLQILKKTPFARGVPDALAEYTVRGNSVSSNKIAAARFQWRVYREIERLSLTRSIWCFSHYAVYGVFRTYVKAILSRAWL